MKKRGHSGFTLIEAMVTIVVLGIIAAVAIPNYSRYVTRGKLVEATNALEAYRVQMEQWYLENRVYGSDNPKDARVECNVCPPGTDCYAAQCDVCGPALPTSLANFAVTCQVIDGTQAFTATATGAGNTAGFTYSINQANVRSTLSLPGYWGALPYDAATRWVTK